MSGQDYYGWRIKAEPSGRGWVAVFWPADQSRWRTKERHAPPWRHDSPAAAVAAARRAIDRGLRRVRARVA